ncbi:MAG: SH3 domain-containing protein [Prevotella sp.]|nr:SH3 domain-containing protein [Prevotella sp.]
MKKQLFPVLFSALMPLTAVAQSSDAGYPEGTWINELPAEEPERPFSVEITVNRVTEVDKEHNNVMSCGFVEVGDNKSDKIYLSGHLNYAGKGLSNGVSNGVYYFTVTPSDGQKCQLGLKKTTDGKVLMVSLTGPLSSHAFLKESLFLQPMNGSWVPATIEPCTEKELLDNLADALNDYDKERIAYRTRGYGNVRQYVNAHKNLDPTKAKYAKPKGAGAVNIRADRSTTADKVGELTPGETLLVTDEYDGWCQVWIADKKFGWVSLSVVTLTNSKGAEPAAATKAQPTPAPAAATKPAAVKPSSFTLANGKLGPLYIGQTVASLPKSVEGLYDNYKYETFEVENDMEGSWTEEWCHFYKNGKEIFKSFAEGKILSSFVLMEGSSFIKTSEGFYVGYPARDLFNKKRMRWETYYEGTAFGTSGHFIYHVDSNDIIGGVETPTRVTHIKQTAKIKMIVYNK